MGRQPEFMTTFKKILVANRGEIAARIIRTCRDLGVKVVAVYSDADRTSLHVRMADEAYHLGGATPQDSYLDVDRIVELAARSGAEAIHPGYGFVSENPSLAEACTRAGIIFVGPTADAMRKVGEKTGARVIAESVGVAIVPGAVASAGSLGELKTSAREIGYPVLLKASAGGGGKGMRRVDSDAELADAFRAASSEAGTAFGDRSVYVEKLLESPRHVEVQFLADNHGTVVCLGERDCSIQRRHQKLIEETPSPAVDPELRSALFDATERVARAAGYTNAGTIEFLLDRQGNHYFLEVNARLQVEHPVTEEATGLDLVREQLKVATGARLDSSLKNMQLPRRAAIECRIYAEDSRNRFIPSPGVVRALEEPRGHGVRVESASYPGMMVGLDYDPLLAKLVTWGTSREEAIARMRRALQEYLILGVKTTIPFHRFVMEDAEFLRGSYDTGFASRWLASAEALSDELAVTAAAAVGVLAWRERSARIARRREGAGGSGWGQAARQAALRWR
jgi:acetyl-CoA carboxylase biotin carboxylase subunit